MIINPIMQSGETAEIFITGLSSTDTVTCTSPSSESLTPVWTTKVISSVSTNGWDIVCKEYGTYSITATNGTLSKSTSVLVDAAEEYDIEMDYKLWLYDEGDECTSVTGGWSDAYKYMTNSYYSTGGYVTKGSTTITVGLSSEKNTNVATRTANSIDLTGYSTLHISIADYYSDTTNKWTGILVSETTDDSVASAGGTGITATGNLTVDISDIEAGSYYIILSVCDYGDTAYTIYETISQIWLE